jgi:Tat protein secretion system quality control protein TatD with DNase activity
MFDAHRHQNLDAPQNRNALYASASQTQWKALQGVQKPAIAGIGSLFTQPFPLMEEFERMVKEHPDYQIAEVGLDKRFGNLEQQQQFLDEVLQLAYQYSRSVSLHCVQASSLLLRLLRKRRATLPPLLWHGFTESYETALEASRLNIILSYGPRLYKSKLAREEKRLITFPFALETDYEHTQEAGYQALLEQHIQNFCALCSIHEEQLIRNNDEIRTILTNQ